MGVFGRRTLGRVVSPLRVARRKNLLASGDRMTNKTGESVRRLHQPWQSRSFSYYDLLGEIKNAAQFYSRMLAPLELFAGEYNEEGELIRTDDPDAIDALERIQDPGGGRTVLLSTYGRLMFLAGECMLFVTADEDGTEQWEMLSTDELRYEGGRYSRYKAPSLGVESFKAIEGDEADAFEPVEAKTAVAYRLWQRHPRYSMLADSTMQGVLDLCEELLLLTQAVRSRSRSRLAGSGILLYDGRISPPPPKAEGDEDPEEDIFISDLTEAMTTPIADEGAASSVVPLGVRVDLPTGSGDDKLRVQDMIHHLQIVDPTQLYPETGLRFECIKRIAIGLDMPPEELLGMDDANHWTAWQIDENKWKAHGQPKAKQLVDDITASFYRPYLASVMGPEKAAKFAIGYDAAAVINRPDRAKDGKDLYDKRAIGKKALRESAGFDDTDAPTKQELAEMVGIAVRDGRLAWEGELSEAPAPAPVEQPDDEDPTDGGAAEVTKGAPPETPDVQADKEPQDKVTAALTARVLGAADLALLRVREKAGAMLISHTKKDEAVRESLKGVRTSQVAATLGRQKVRELRAPSDANLVSGTYTLIVDALRQWGINGSVGEEIAGQIEQHAARTLYDMNPRGLPDSFPGYVTGLLKSGRE